jgi:phospholipase/carboxylesterase
MLHTAMYGVDRTRDQEGATVAVMLHGRGSDEQDMLGLARGLPDEWVVVALRAPFDAAAWGYGTGYAWYRFMGEDRVEPESFETSHAALGEVLDGLETVVGFTPGRVVLGGFSQGGTMALSHALRRPGRVPMAVNFSGFLASHPSVRATPESVKDTRFFWGHGTRDPNIPYDFAVRGREALQDAGADLTVWSGAIGHWIDPVELKAMVEWAEGKAVGVEVE